MTTILPFNFKKPNEYEFYHVRILNSDSVASDYFDLSFEEAKQTILKSNCDYIVIGTIEKVNDCLSYINEQKYIANGIMFWLERKDIFQSADTIFVNCTEYFKHT